MKDEQDDIPMVTAEIQITKDYKNIESMVMSEITHRMLCKMFMRLGLPKSGGKITLIVGVE